jgi:hypothetical protein
MIRDWPSRKSSLQNESRTEFHVEKSPDPHYRRRCRPYP